MQPAAAALYVELSDVQDTTIIAIWKHIFSLLDTKNILSGMLVCQSFLKELPSLVTSVRIAGMKYPFNQKQLEHLAKTFPNLKELHINQDYSDHSPKLDFSKVKMLVLESLYLHCVPISSCCFTQKNTPQLRRLSTSNSSNFKRFDLDLPHLESITMEHTQVDNSRNFGPSLNKCPKLRMFNSYKLWGLSGTKHELHLPECDTFEVSRSDDLEALELWAPKLQMLGLRACYSLEHVRIMDDEDPVGTQLAPLTVSLINANIDPFSKRHLKQHPRVKAGAVWTKESQEWGGMMADMGVGMDDDGMPSDDLDSDDQDLEGMEGIEAMLAAMQGGPAAGGAMNADVMQLMMLAGAMNGMPGMGGMQGLQAQLMQQSMAGGPQGVFGFDDGMDEEEDEEDDEEEDSGSWQTDDEDAEDSGMDEGGAGGEAAGNGRAGGAGAPSCVIEEEQ